MTDEPAYWTIRIGEAQSKEAFDLGRAEQLYERLCAEFADEEISLCEVWIKPVKTRSAVKENAPSTTL